MDWSREGQDTRGTGVKRDMRSEGQEARGTGDVTTRGKKYVQEDRVKGRRAGKEGERDRKGRGTGGKRDGKQEGCLTSNSNEVIVSCLT